MVVLSERLGFGGRPEAVLGWVEALIGKLDLPTRLGEIDVRIDNLARIARMAIKAPCAGGNPVELTQMLAEEVLLKAA